jgi:hypothetical protein
MRDTFPAATTFHTIIPVIFVAMESSGRTFLVQAQAAVIAQSTILHPPYAVTGQSPASLLLRTTMAAAAATCMTIIHSYAATVLALIK